MAHPALPHFALSRYFPAISLFATLAISSPLSAGFVKTDRDVAITTAGMTVILTPLDDAAIRVTRYGPVEPSVTLPDTDKTVSFAVGEDNYFVTVKTAQMSAAVDKATGCLRFFDEKGLPLAAEKAGTSTATPGRTLGEDCLSVSQVFVTQRDEKLFGTGQFQDGEFSVNDLPRRLAQYNTQIAIPFVLSSKGYGILWHNLGETLFNMDGGALRPARFGKTGEELSVWDWNDGVSSKITREEWEYVYEYEAKTSGRIGVFLLNGAERRSDARLEADGKIVLEHSQSAFVDLTKGRHVFRVVCQGGAPALYVREASDSFSFASPVANALDYVIFAGKNPAEAIAAYRRVTGEAPMLPKWAYGFVQCRERYETQDQLVDSLKGYRERKIPVDLIVQDWQYWGKYGWNAMRFDEETFPDPAKMVRAVHDAHGRVMISIWSKVGSDTDLGKKLAANKYFIGDTEWIDFTNPAAAAFYWQNIDKTFNSIGFDAWWLDATEPEDDAMTGRKVFAGSSDRVRNSYPLLVSRAVYTGQRAASPEKRVLILTRSAFSGQQRYASCVWSGDIGSDWNTFRKQIPAGLDYVASGLPYWTTDCGGFVRPDDQYESADYHELLIRWLQFSAFCPLMRIHGLASHTEVWNYGADVERQAREMIELRYRMLPYAYSCAGEVTRNGGSLMRPLVMDFADDLKGLDAKYAYMYGPSILVAPVVEKGAKTCAVYLPKVEGGWRDFFTGARYEGGKSVDFDVSGYKFPLLVRAGGILPLAPVAQYVGEKPADSLEIRVYAGADGSFKLYDDDGVSYAYENGRFSLVALSWNDERKTLSISAREGSYEGMPAKVTIDVVLYGPDGGPLKKSVVYDGNPAQITFK
jgi:alpha-D-xyloside xylohydrolase